MHTHRLGVSNRSLLLTSALVLTVAVAGLATPSLAVMDATTECLAGWEGVPDANANGGTLSCSDCDPNCDTDGQTTPNLTCTFRLQACLNQTDSGGSCVPGDLKKVKVKKVSGNCRVAGLRPTPSGTSSVCGAFTDVIVKTKRRGRKTGKCKILFMAATRGPGKRVDKDALLLECVPQAASTCPTTTTTTTTSSTTTTLASICGDNTVAGDEACDPPCQAGGACTGGMVCNSACSGCITPGPCDTVACGSPAPTQLKFTTTQATIGVPPGCGSVKDVNDVDQRQLDCGGLYFGGGGVAVPLPAVVPDMGTNLLGVGCCEASGTTMQLVATTDQSAGASALTCTSSTVDNQIYGAAKPGCLFGAPLPIPNAIAPALSTCIINRVAKNASGTASCSTGAASISLPLLSDLYLTADTLDCTNDNGNDVVGIQPCPLCRRVCASKVCKGGANNGNACAGGDCPGGFCCTRPCSADPDCPSGVMCGAGDQCLGGPRNGLTCTPGDTDVPTVCIAGANVGDPCTTDGDCPGSICNHPYPTSHDCPPPEPYIGSLSIPFALTTGTSTKTANDLGSETGQVNAFCGFCGSGVAFKNPPVSCASDADCAGLTGCGSETGSCRFCKQRASGAFTLGDARTIVATGSPAGPLDNRTIDHPSTLVSVFCIPPSYNGAVDSTADLPGPGAVSLPGVTRLLP